MNTNDWIASGLALFNLLLSAILFAVELLIEKADKKQNNKEHNSINEKTESYRKNHIQELDHLRDEIKDISWNLSASWMVMNNYSHEDIQLNLEKAKSETKEFWDKQTLEKNKNSPKIDINQIEDEFHHLKEGKRNPNNKGGVYE